MDFAVGSLLFLGKWVLIALIYLMLIAVLVAVRREMGQRLQNPELPGAAVPGRLRVLQGGDDPRLTPGFVFNLPTVVVIGADKKRLSKQDLVIQDRYISGRHAQMSWDGAYWWVKDLGSANGTRVNGRECMPQENIHVPLGSTVQFGNVVFELLG